jgi:hypothetical protein
MMDVGQSIAELCWFDCYGIILAVVNVQSAKFRIKLYSTIISGITKKHWWYAELTTCETTATLVCCVTSIWLSTLLMFQIDYSKFRFRCDVLLWEGFKIVSCWQFSKVESSNLTIWSGTIIMASYLIWSMFSLGIISSNLSLVLNITHCCS